MSRHHFIGKDGLTLAADHHGPADGAPVLLLHGGGQTRHAWGATARMLAERGYHAIAMDLRGHGDSGWSPEGDYGLMTFGADVSAAIESIGRPVVLVGASLGGMASLLASAKAAPGQVRALILVDITPVPRPSGADGIRGFMSASPNGFADLDEVADAVAAYLPHRRRPSDPRGLMKNLRERDGRLYWHWDPAFIEGTFQDRSLTTNAMAEGARAITAPTLLVRGENSELVGPEDVVAFRQIMPHAEIITVPGARHMVAGDQNTEFGAALLDYVQRIAPA
ncbi:pimeloyl-ACP methyl ester carboxylesterase [Caulobacter ginsengisoli]|uniref:Pimeloyl-ACP methyl ester carboxylesterase n=1 Tax=Caulobacter ginsengisoli TaxID=400775 RepID=A0ABU0ISL6_9CAUL|nr:alpha/beta hydrolase [Caulobacter ginsengisoli]MDQ0465003.1 pimeloyl-ACP methyl ester carboxylesterase [Caulobacter ginsengisoli]